MEKDYARELAERWALDWNVKDSSTESARTAIEGAIREALAKAAEIADQAPADSLAEAGLKGHILYAIRALGAKP